MTRSELLDNLLEGIKRNNPLDAKWDLVCDECDADIDKGGEFFFIGKAKVCGKCRDEIINDLKEWLHDERKIEIDRAEVGRPVAGKVKA